MNIIRLLDALFTFLLLWFIPFGVERWLPWIFAKPAAHAWTILFVPLVVWLLVRGLWQGMRWGLVERTHSTVLVLRLGRYLLSGLIIFVVVGSVLWVSSRTGTVLMNQFRVRNVVAGLSLETLGILESACVGMRAAKTAGGRLNAKPLLPEFFRDMSGSEIKPYRIVVYNELQQKGIVKPIPPKRQGRWETQIFEPTPFGRQVCSYLITRK